MKLVYLIGIAVVVIAGALFLRKPHSSTTQAPSTAKPMQADSVETAPQKPGDFVTIPRVVLSHPGFVMIHRAQGTYPGEIVMTGNLLPAGESTNVVVHGVKTKPGEEYFAMLHRDNGNGVYDDPGTDPPVVKSGAIVEEKFIIQ